jgi:hypothetical protein
LGRPSPSLHTSPAWQWPPASPPALHLLGSAWQRGLVALGRRRKRQRDCVPAPAHPHLTGCMVAGRASGVRRALATCLRSLAAQQGGCSSSRAAALSPLLVDDGPSPSYGASPPAWPWRRSGGRGQHAGVAAAAEAPPRQSVYQLVVVTGDVRGAGSAAPAVIKLVGTGAPLPAQCSSACDGRDNLSPGSARAGASSRQHPHWPCGFAAGACLVFADMSMPPLRIHMPACMPPAHPRLACPLQRARASPF